MQSSSTLCENVSYSSERRTGVIGDVHGFQLATGKKGRFLYDLHVVRAGNQPALGASLVPDSYHYRSWRSGVDDGNKTIRQLPKIVNGMDTALLNVSVVVRKSFDTGTTHTTFWDTLQHLLKWTNSSVCFTKLISLCFIITYLCSVLCKRSALFGPGQLGS